MHQLLAINRTNSRKRRDRPLKTHRFERETTRARFANALCIATPVRTDLTGRASHWLAHWRQNRLEKQMVRHAHKLPEGVFSSAIVKSREEFLLFHKENVSKTVSELHLQLPMFCREEHIARGIFESWTFFKIKFEKEIFKGHVKLDVRERRIKDQNLVSFKIICHTAVVLSFGECLCSVWMTDGLQGPSTCICYCLVRP